MYNKTRQEQIEIASSNYYDRFPYYSPECNFRHGAQWADGHPNIKWHDLRKDPNDLPLNYPNIISKKPSKMFEGSTKRVIAIYDDDKIRLDRMVKSYIRTQDGTKLEWVWLSYTIQKHVLAWMEIPKFKD